jgi:hypothetical protein
MKVTDKEYLELILKSARLELNETEVCLRISIAEGEAKKEMLRRQINSIERQLEEGIR